MNLFTLRKSRGLLAGLLLMTLLATMIFPGAVLAAEPYDTYNNLALQAVRNNYGLYQGGTPVTSSHYTNFGAYGAYVLDKAGINLTEWAHEGTSFADSISALIDETIAGPSSANRVAYEYLAAKEMGDSRADSLLVILTNRQTTRGDGSFDDNIYSNMPAFDALARTGDIAELDTAAAIIYLLGTQDDASGAWGSPGYPDIAVTAQAVRALLALEPLAGGDALSVQTAIGNGVSWLQSCQQDDGSFSAPSWDPLIDTVEALLTMKALGLSLDTWKEGGKSAVDYMRDDALNDDGTFGGSGNLYDNTMALEAYLLLDAAIPEDKTLALTISPKTVDLAIDEEQAFTAEAFLANGSKKDVTSDADWAVSDPAIAELTEDGDSVTVGRMIAGDFQVTAAYQGLSAAVSVGLAADPSLAGVTVRIEGPNYTILPDTVIYAPPGSSYTQVLVAGADDNDYTVDETGGFVNAINGIGAPVYWLVAPWQSSGYNNGDWFTMSANGSSNTGVAVLSASARQPGESITVTVTYKDNEDMSGDPVAGDTADGMPVEGAKVIYYTAANYQTPTEAGITDANGQLTFSIGTAGTYYVAADKTNTGVWPDPDDGLVRTAAQTVVVSSGGGHTSGTPVRIEVVGKNGKTLYARRTVYLEGEDYRNARGDKIGLSPVEALDKTGLSYDYDSISYIHTIAGLAPEGLNGWMVKVNGTSLKDAAYKEKLSSNDLVVWFYSTDSGNLAGMSGPNPQQNKTGDQLITDALKDNKEVVIDLAKQANGLLQLKPETVQKLAEAQKPLNISGKGLEIAMTPQALGTEQVQAALEGGAAALQLGIKEVTSAEKQEILTGAKLGQSTGIFEIGGKIFDLSAELISTDSEGNQITERISSFGEPVPVTLDLSGLNLTGEDSAQLTAVRYEKDAAGKIIPVKLGGSYDPETKVFTFYTEKFSYYGIAKAEKLVTVSMGIDKLTVTINGKRGYTDAPPVLLNNRTMAPLRFIAETLGAQVQWLAESRTAEIRLDGQTLRLVAEELVPGMDTPATIKSARLLVPLRYISEALGARVTWFAAEQRIELVY
ncbi:MAG: stalk domain-containing protein [Clostridia bacterium]|jgi:hypothetical protein|nr:stalk domain-containing protein [Clostridia bacterium]